MARVPVLLVLAPSCPCNCLLRMVKSPDSSTTPQSLLNLLLRIFLSHPFTTASSRSSVLPAFEQVFPDTTVSCISLVLKHPPLDHDYDHKDTFSISATS